MSFDYIELTRQELYDQIWKEPLSQVASGLGISDVGLAKLCRRNRIPVPYRGFWARRESGQTPPVTRLPALPEGKRDRIVLRRRREQPEQVASPELLAALAKEKDYAALDSVPDQIGRSHRVVAEARAAYKGRYVTRYGHIDRKRVKGVLDILVSPGQLGRALRIAQGIAVGAERRGYSFDPGDDWHGARIVVRGQKVDFSIEESSRQLPLENKPATPDKKITDSTWLNRVEREYRPTGRFTLKINSYIQSSIRTRWGDSENDPIEGHLSDFFESALRVSFELEVREKERQVQEARWQAEEKNRREIDAAARALEELATQYERYTRLQRLVDALDEKKLVMDKPVGSYPSWREWAAAHLDRLNPLKVPEGSGGSDANAS